MNKTVTALIFISLFVLSTFMTANAQETEIKGTVTEADTGNPLPGVNIKVDNTTIGTFSDKNGNYTLSVPDSSNVLIFSYIGFKTNPITINGRTTIDVAMESQEIQGEQIVVVGYGTQKKSDLTGSVSQVSGDDVNKIPTSNVQDALQGKIAGVQITPPNGRPNAQPVVRIRGVGTLNDASPLYVVDGLLTNDISYLNTDNVESVDVLKDASATAIYGSRGANGVIVITTKKGTAGTSQIAVNSYFGIQRVSNKIDVANARQFATLANESAVNAGNPPVFDDPSQFGQGTDYQDLIFDNEAPIQNYNITASGGNDNLVYSISGNYFKQDGIVRGANYQRVSLRLNNQYFLTDHVKFGHNISFDYNDSENEANDLVNAALRADPTLPPRNEDGTFTNLGQNGGGANPIAAIAYNNNHGFGFRTVGNAYLDIDFLKNFDFNSSFSLDLRRNQTKTFVPLFNVSPIQSNTTNNLNVEDDDNTDWIIKNTLQYQNNWQDHQLKLLGGITYQKSKFEKLGGARMNFPGTDPAFFFLDAGDATGETNFNSSTASGIVSYLFRANYTFKNRYLFTGTYRIDGSSKFGANHRYGYFPSIGVGWRISDEPFFNVPDINYLKLRGSWGKIGNDKINSNAAIPLVNASLPAVFGLDQHIEPGATVTALANPNLKYEETEQYDAGLEIGLFDDAINAEVDYYSKRTNDILVSVPIPGYVGAGAPVVNAASVLNSGFDINVNWSHTIGKFSYQLGFVGSTIHNEVVELGKNQENILGGNSGNNLGLTTRTDVGHPIGEFYGYKVIGVLQSDDEANSLPTLGTEQAGDLKFADTDGDGTITPADRVFLGSSIPDFTLGFNLSANYQNIDFTLNIDGQFGNKVLNARKAARGFRLLNYDASFLDRYTGPGTSNTEPRITEGGVDYQTDRFLEDGDFVRLRNIQIGYSVPSSSISNLNIKKIRIYADAKNLFTDTNYSGYTPQVAESNVLNNGIDNGVFPVASTYTLGIQLQF